MKKFVLFLLAAFLVTGLAGCTDDELEIEDMAGKYTLSKITITPPGTVYSFPDVSGYITLTSSGTFSGTVTTPNGADTVSGSFTVDDPVIVFAEEDGEKRGEITDDGNTITITDQDYQAQNTAVFEFNKQ